MYRIGFVLMSLLGVVSLAGFTGAATVTVTLDDVPDVVMGETFTEAGVAMSLFGSFFVDNDGTPPEGVWVYPGMFMANFGSLPEFTTNPVEVEIDINDDTGVGSVGAFLYDNGVLLDQTTNASTGWETLFLSGGPGADLIVVFGYETFIDELRFTAVPIPSAVLLFASGLAGIVGLRRRVKR